MKALKYIVLITLITVGTSCKKYVEVDPSHTELAAATVFVNDRTATAAMVGVYADMNSYNYFFANIVTMFLGSMNADEFIYAATLPEFDEFKNNQVLAGNRYILLLWSQPYDYIYRCNAIIEGVTASSTLTPEVKSQLLGEARFMRAFCYFYLTNIFGDVPLILDTDVRKNTGLPRTASKEVYKVIIADLLAAKSLLSSNYVGEERIRPNKAAATLLLARAYLYTGDNVKAESEASEVIANPAYELLQGSQMNNTFLANSAEAVWQLRPVNISGNRNTWEGFTIVPVNMTDPVAYYRFTKDPVYGLTAAFEPGDLRKANWTGHYTTNAMITHTFPYKYKVRTSLAVTEYSMVLRFAEAYLIRAEARVQLSKFSLAKEDIDKIRSRAGLLPVVIPASVMDGMLKIEQERRVELFAEWGHRWFDLKRWKSILGAADKTRADDILPATKPGWKSTAVLMPIPTDARKTNINLSQNDGYH